jgi:hypothetical protein
LVGDDATPKPAPSAAHEHHCPHVIGADCGGRVHHHSGNIGRHDAQGKPQNLLDRPFLAGQGQLVELAVDPPDPLVAKEPDELRAVPQFADGAPSMSYFPSPAALTIAAMPARIAAGRPGQAVIIWARSGSVSGRFWQREWQAQVGPSAQVFVDSSGCGFVPLVFETSPFSHSGTSPAHRDGRQCRAACAAFLSAVTGEDYTGLARGLQVRTERRRVKREENRRREKREERRAKRPTSRDRGRSSLFPLLSSLFAVVFSLFALPSSSLISSLLEVADGRYIFC